MRRVPGGLTALTTSILLVLSVSATAATTSRHAHEAGNEEVQAPSIVVEANEPTGAVSAYLTGTNSNEWFDNARGIWDPDRDAPDPEVVRKTASTGMNLIRYPGGTSANLYDWKRAIGPTEQRGCQTDGRKDRDSPRDSVYGPDEHAAFVAAAGAEMLVMVAWANETPDDAADWVEYMNAEVGTNPRGGTAWADVRAENGHAEPYGVKFWEVGNEIDRRAERYWASQDNLKALHQYTFGGTEDKVGERAARECDHGDNAAVSDGEQSQRLEVRYPPVVPDSQTVYVDGVAWSEVEDLSAAGQDDTVYSFDPQTGEILFGDGAHGAVPVDGAVVTADYTSGPHPGFVDFYEEMKQADPSIDVCSTWAPVRETSGLDVMSFPELMDETGHADEYDCVNIHPYANFKSLFGRDDWDSAREGHDEYFLGEEFATGLLEDLVDEVAQHNDSGAYVGVTEFGALWFGHGGIDLSSYPGWDTAMSHVTYMAAQWTRFSNLGAPYAIGNAFLGGSPEDLRTVLGGAPGFVYTGDAVAREQLIPFIDGGGQVVENRVDHNPQVSAEASAPGETYDALAVTAAVGDDGKLRIVVVNSHPVESVTANVVPAGYVHDGTVDISVVAGDSYLSFNSLEHPDDIQIVESKEAVRSNAFLHAFAPASVTVLTLTGKG